MSFSAAHQHDYAEGGKHRNSSSVPGTPGEFEAVDAALKSVRKEDQATGQLLGKASAPLKPCLRPSANGKSESGKGAINDGIGAWGTQKSEGLRSIQWHDLAGSGELAEVHEYEPRWVGE